MNCDEFQVGLHASLDGLPLTDAASFEQHLASCLACRELNAAALRLRDGLRLLTPPTPPTGFANQIVSRALAERRLRLRRQVVGAVAVAASLLVAATLLILSSQRKTPDQPGNGELV